MSSSSPPGRLPSAADIKQENGMESASEGRRRPEKWRGAAAAAGLSPPAPAPPPPGAGGRRGRRRQGGRRGQWRRRPGRRWIRYNSLGTSGQAPPRRGRRRRANPTGLLARPCRLRVRGAAAGQPGPPGPVPAGPCPERPATWQREPAEGAGAGGLPPGHLPRALQHPRGWLRVG